MKLEYSLMLAILTVSVLLLGSVTTVIFDNFDKILISLGKNPSLSGRTSLWHEILISIQDRPFFRNGYGAFWTEGGGRNYLTGIWLASPSCSQRSPRLTVRYWDYRYSYLFALLRSYLLPGSKTA